MDIKRDISTATLAALSGPFFYPVVMVYLDWPTGVIRAHSGLGNITWDGQTWLGVGKFGAVSIPEETASGVPADFTMSLCCDMEELAECAGQTIRNRPGQIYIGATTKPGKGDLIGAPVEMVSGMMDTLVLATDVTRSDGSVVVQYTLTVGLTTGPSMRSMASIRHSHADQSKQYPGDTAGKRLLLASARTLTTKWPEV